MKLNLTLCVDIETVRELKQLATSIGAPYSVLADLFLRRGIDRADPEGLKKWAAGQKRPANGARRKPGELTRREHILATLKDIAHTDVEGATFDKFQVSKASGLHPAECMTLLHELADRGLVIRNEVPRGEGVLITWRAARSGAATPGATDA